MAGWVVGLFTSQVASFYVLFIWLCIEHNYEGIRVSSSSIIIAITIGTRLNNDGNNYTHGNMVQRI